MSRKTKAFPTALFPESDNRPPLSFGTRGTAIFGHDILTPGANAIVFQQDRRSDRLIPISPPRKCAPRTRMWKLPPDESSINLFVEESMRYFESNYPETDIPRQLMKPLLREGARIEFIDYSTPPFADNQMILYRTELQPQGYVAFAGGAVMNELYFMNRASIGPTTQCVFTPTATFKTPINQISESSQASRSTCTQIAKRSSPIHVALLESRST
ncbi:hypothetical protein BJ742DRAFT_58982 [Cladochytrium replicatum]|nr:hypothetical protein BJ742DRAFT_58982 [Cladochytrium replicatum]